MSKSQTAVDNILNSLIAKLEKMEQFTLEQAPDFFKEIIALKKVQIQNVMISSGIGALMGLSAGIAGGLSISYAIGCTGDKAFGFGMGGMVFAIMGLITLCITGDNLLSSFLELRELKAAPKVIVMQELSDMLHGE